MVEDTLLGNAYTQSILAELGETSWPILIGAPSDSTASNWYIRVSCLECGPGVESATQYVSAMDGSSLSTNVENRHLFSGDTDHSGISIELLSVP